MDRLPQAFIEFIKVRQLNFAVAAVLTCAYLLYQYWDLLFKEKTEVLERCPHSMHSIEKPYSRHERDRSRSRSRGSHREKRGRSRRPYYGRCHGCSKCNVDANT